MASCSLSPVGDFPDESDVTDANAAVSSDQRGSDPDDPPRSGAEPHHERLSTDVLVVGAGTGGVGVAIQAARLGKRVLLVEETDRIGGQISAGVGTIDSALWGNESGIYAEFDHLIVARYAAAGRSTSTCYWSTRTRCIESNVAHEVLSGMLAAEPNITTLTRSTVVGVRRDGVLVTGATITGPGGRKLVASRVLVDATEWGDVLPLAGAAYRVGKSTNTSRPVQGCVQDTTYVAVIRRYPGGVPQQLRIAAPPPGYATDAPLFREKLSTVKECLSEPTSTTPPPCYDWTRGDPRKFPVNWRTYVAYRGLPDSLNPSSYTSSQPDAITLTALNWFNDYPLDVRAVEDRDVRRQRVCEAQRRTLSLIYFIQKEIDPTWSVATDQYPTEPLDGCPLPFALRPIASRFAPIPYVRESRRLIGVDTLTGQDLLRVETPAPPAHGRVRHADAMAIGDYPVDLHNCDRDDDLEPPESTADLSPKGGTFQIPMGVAVPQAIDGLLAAEKNISQSRVANGATRLQPVTMMAGQSIGALAAIAVDRGVQPRDVPAILVQDVVAKAGLRLAQDYTVDTANPRWFAGVQVAMTRDLMSVYPDHTFRPHLPITRTDASTLFATLALIGDLPPPTSPTFDDVPSDHPAFRAIEAVAVAGLMTPCGSKRFCPDAPLTRASGAFAFDLLRPRDGLVPAMSFVDVNGTHPVAAIAAAVSMGAISPCAADRFCPTAGLIRGDVATLATRLLVIQAER